MIDFSFGYNIIKDSLTFIRKIRGKNHDDFPLRVSHVINQGYLLGIPPDDQPKKISDIKYSLNDLLLNKSEIKQYLADLSSDKDNIIEMQRRYLILNTTRISTFVAFTDYEKILIFDRLESDKKSQAILNNKKDVFGARDFTNSTIEYKISNSQGFFNSSILKFLHIPGLAIESNYEPDISLLSNVTTIMMGFAVVISSKDIEKAKAGASTQLEILDKNEIQQLSGNDFTAKARLAISYIFGIIK